MARYKVVDTNPQFLSVDLARQLLPGTVEHVFGNVRYNKRLDRFTLRGRTKVNGQWLLFCLVHNIEKLTHAGYAA